MGTVPSWMDRRSSPVVSDGLERPYIPKSARLEPRITKLLSGAINRKIRAMRNVTGSAYPIARLE